jgi:ElaB/YqjD/DUF883 family membrane-anchored ribosome-binding protein
MDENTATPSGDSADTTAGRFDRAKEFVGDKYSAASESVRSGFNTVKEKVDDVDYGEVFDHVRGYVRSHPGKALLISVGVGFLVGLLLRSDDSED